MATPAAEGTAMLEGGPDSTMSPPTAFPIAVPATIAHHHHRERLGDRARGATGPAASSRDGRRSEQRPGRGAPRRAATSRSAGRGARTGAEGEQEDRKPRRKRARPVTGAVDERRRPGCRAESEREQDAAASTSEPRASREGGHGDLDDADRRAQRGDREGDVRIPARERAEPADACARAAPAARAPVREKASALPSRARRDEHGGGR